MSTIKIELEMPEEILKYVNLEDKAFKRKIKELFLYQIVSENKISFGKAAELIGISKIEYISDLGKMGLPYFESSIEEVTKDIETLAEYIRES